MMNIAKRTSTIKVKMPPIIHRNPSLRSSSSWPQSFEVIFEEEEEEKEEEKKVLWEVGRMEIYNRWEMR